jgi:hypothetical protein
MKGEDSIKSDYQNVNAIIEDEYSYHYIRFTAKKKQVGKRGASLQSLDQTTLTRLLTKNYSLLVCMVPLTHQIRVLGSSAICPPILGPGSSSWFRLLLYSLCGQAIHPSSS